MNDNKRGPSAFVVAKTAAAAITCPDPEQDQPDEYRVLVAAIRALAEEDEISAPGEKPGQKALCFQMSKDIILETVTRERRASTFCLYAASKLAGMAGIASGTVAIRNAIVLKVNDVWSRVLTMQDLCDARLLSYTPRTDRSGRPYSTECFHLGNDSLRAARDWLRSNGKTASAEVLSEHLNRAEINKMRRQATAAANPQKAEIA